MTYIPRMYVCISLPPPQRSVSCCSHSLGGRSDGRLQSQGREGASLSSPPLFPLSTCLTLSEKQYSLVRDEMKERLPSSEVECMISWPARIRMASCNTVKSFPPTCRLSSQGALVCFCEHSGNDLASPTRGDCAALLWPALIACICHTEPADGREQAH